MKLSKFYTQVAHKLQILLTNIVIVSTGFIFCWFPNRTIILPIPYI